MFPSQSLAHRDSSVEPNVYIKRHNGDNTFTLISQGKVQAVESLGADDSNIAELRYDCIDQDFTAYYKNGSDYIPFITGRDSVLTNGFVALGYGPIVSVSA